MKKYIYTVLILILASVLGAACRFYHQAQDLKAKYERASNNLEATELSLSNAEQSNREYWYTIKELKMSKDSINQKLLDTASKLKIKEKNIQYLQYQTSTISKVDTITIEGDTIFRDRIIPIDTTISDNWHSTRLRLAFPSTIIVAPTFKSEKEVIVSKKKEYNNKPSKIFFIRWFQKKHDIVTVDIIENNPYIEEGQNKFIKIVE